MTGVGEPTECQGCQWMPGMEEQGGFQGPRWVLGWEIPGMLMPLPAVFLADADREHAGLSVLQPGALQAWQAAAQPAGRGAWGMGQGVPGGPPRLPCPTPPPSLCPPGQECGGEARVDSPHQAAHSGESPCHHPPKGEGGGVCTSVTPGTPRHGEGGQLYPTLASFFSILPPPRLRKPSWRWTCSVSAIDALPSPLCPPLSPLFSLASPPVPTDPPRLPRCSPERLKKSWSCQPLGDAATEPLQGRRQSGESRVSPVFLLSHVFPPLDPTTPLSPGPSCGWVAPMPAGRVALGADGAPVPTEPFQHQGHTEMLLERLQGHGGRRQSGVDSGRDQGARGADELGDMGVMPMSPPLPPEPTKHNLWHLGKQGELTQPRHRWGRRRGGWGPWGEFWVLPPLISAFLYLGWQG